MSSDCFIAIFRPLRFHRMEKNYIFSNFSLYIEPGNMITQLQLANLHNFAHQTSCSHAVFIGFTPSHTLYLLYLYNCTFLSALFGIKNCHLVVLMQFTDRLCRNICPFLHRPHLYWASTSVNTTAAHRSACFAQLWVIIFL